MTCEPAVPRQGEAVVVTVSGSERPPTGLFFLGRRYRLAPAGGVYKAVLAVPLAAAPGRRGVEIAWGERRETAAVLTVRAGNYDEEHLTLPPEMVSPKQKSHLRQIRRDRQLLRRVYGSSGSAVLFNRPFIMPLESRIITPFGRRRFLNGQPKSPHGGIDLRGRTGVPVKASAAGRVALAGSLYYSGNAVIIDHGLDIFSLYLHLSKISVRDGEQVRRGQVIGYVGSTGRVTGPHLHWGIKINGIFVDPLAFIKESRLLVPAAEN
ncbi:MAG: M23 family metallopeptidase [Deltaproteobacteria bacterium]|nr:M23 family metallopeptidase [Deltaproteobacteria bacterium]